MTPDGDRRHAAESGGAANLGKDDFLAVLSHELRTPLTSILGWTRIMRSSTLDAKRAAKALEVIERNATAQAQLVNDILDVSRIVSGKLRLEMSVIERPAALVEAAVESLRPAAAARGVRLESMLQPDAGPVRGDPERLQQIVGNLVSNAIKFGGASARVDVTLVREGEAVEIVVADTGRGIWPEHLPHVFERFRQFESATMREHGGLGLGLAIVRHLVEQHGGTVAAASPGDGMGSTFTVRLPVHLEGAGVDVGASGAANAPAQRPSLEGLRVLVVEDVADARALVVAVLTNAGARVDAADGSVAALERIRAGTVDAIVCDIGLPGEDGNALIRRVRTLDADRGRRTPAIALTAYASLDDRARALAAGFDAHMAKPVDPDALVVAVAKAAGLRAQGRSRKRYGQASPLGSPARASDPE